MCGPASAFIVERSSTRGAPACRRCSTSAGTARRSPGRPGRSSWRKASAPGRLLVLAEGVVEVFRGAVDIALIDEPGAVFGEMAVLLDQPHTASVQATTQVVMHVVPEPRPSSPSTRRWPA
ncbi:MAG: cyclic nucleotide-binding domain-containing protein [Geminicoccaceae bacterium]